MKFEEGTRTSTDRLIPKEYLKEAEMNVGGEGLAKKEKLDLCAPDYII